MSCYTCMSDSSKPRSLCFYTRVGALLFLLLLMALQARAQSPSQGMKKLKAKPSMQGMEKLKAKPPLQGYILAHKDIASPPDLLGGPIHVTVSQEEGGVFVALPDQRRLDPYVFGTPDMPRAFAGTPGINGVPLMGRAQENGQYTRMTQPSPFGDKYIVMADGKLTLQATDATATDGASTKDRVQLQARWRDRAGNTYEVRCCQMLASHGLEFPTFGGVVTNHILHGSSRLGSALMPTEFVFLAFWGMGEVRKNGQVLDRPRLIHGMLTEYVRTEGYKLAFDDQVTPTRMHFHLMVPPFMPDPAHLSFVSSPVKTGFELPNHRTLPFWHVMFENLQIQAGHEQ